MIVAMTNPIRFCVACKQADDHPRHEIAGTNGADSMTDGPMHMDCCAEARGCALCAAQLERARVATGETWGRPLGDTLHSLPPVQVDHVPNDDPNDPYNLTTAVVTEI